MNFAEAQHARIVGIQHGDARLLADPQRLDQLALSERHAFDRIEGFHVRVSHVGNHADIRLGDGRQRANLARVIHAHFEDAHVRFVRQAQDRKRHAHVVIEVAHGLANWQFDGQQVRDGILGGGLARAAGHAHDAAGPMPARPGGQILQSGERIRYH